MENTNPTGKSLDELMKEAEEKNIKIAIIGADGIGESARVILEKMMMKEKIILVNIGDLSDDDQKKVAEMNLQPINPEPPLKYVARPKMEDIELKPYQDELFRGDNSHWHKNLPNGKKRKKH